MPSSDNNNCTASATSHPAPWLAFWRLGIVTMLGFASGLPLGLTGQALQAWLSMDGIDLATIGFLSLVGLPYTFKFLWAPLMDRFEPWGLERLLGRRRGWLVLSQLALAGTFLMLAQTTPSAEIRLFSLLALLAAFLSASQDVVIDAYRTDVLPTVERGLGASLSVLGYRLAMLLSGGIVLIWTDPSAAGTRHGWTWPQVYQLMALLMVGAAALSALALPRLPELDRTSSANAKSGQATGHDLLGFLAVAVAAACGVALTDRYGVSLAQMLLSPFWDLSTTANATHATPGLLSPLQRKWVDLIALLLGIAFTLPLAAWAARVVRFETLLRGLANYFAQPGARAFLAFIVLYKLGDAFAGALMTPFLLKVMAFAPAEVGVVNKLIGLWLTIGGALLGGALMMRLGLWRALLLFGLLQMLSNLGFWWLAVAGKGALPGWVIPAFDWGLVALVKDTPVDGGLLAVIVVENLSGGMGTAAFVAFLMSLTSQRYTATQYALLSAFASVGRVWVGPMAGVLAESIGWPAFFLLSTAAALPALALLIWLKPAVRLLEGHHDRPAA
ncbi:AmpG family muropeptide MFS transporter [Leptothrix ochracea]|uniref:AmpG family muropeptide MFS transporter n=1 Tax=Leptothrix ochracea TaxID=735331 RepID=UPI00387EB7B5